MEEKIIDVMNDGSLAPADFITLMFERTDDEGILYIPGWHHDGPGWLCNAPGSTDENDSYRCRVDWNLAKYERFLEKFNKHYDMLQKISEFRDELDDTVETAKSVLCDEFFDFWNIYIRPFDTGDFDYEKIEDIRDRLDAVESVKVYASNLAKGEAVSAFEKEYITEYIDIAVSDEELMYLDKYHDKVVTDARSRIGDNICAYDVIIRSMRLCRLLSLKAPQIIIYNEARPLAAAMLLHDYGVSKEVVDNSIRLRIEKLETMTEEELDELYRPKKVNTRKSLAPLFVYEILKKKSNSKNHLRQQDILKELERYPYEISLERKALSRIIHNLIDSQYQIYSDKTGVWVEQ